MSQIGFSTGALAKGEIATGVQMARDLSLEVIELSALRLRELDGLLALVATQNLTDFKYVSIHAPTDYGPADENHIADALGQIALQRHWPVILHPDAVHDLERWTSLGPWLYVENMDKRKPKGRTVEELQQILTVVPEAYMCFDIAHARQVDSSMTEAFRILRHFGKRIRQIHFSEVGSDSRHRRVSDSAFRAYTEVRSCLPLEVPIILETVVAGTPTSLVDAAFEIDRVSNFVSQPQQTFAM